MRSMTSFFMFCIFDEICSCKEIFFPLLCVTKSKNIFAVVLEVNIDVASVLLSNWINSWYFTRAIQHRNQGTDQINLRLEESLWFLLMPWHHFRNEVRINFLRTIRYVLISRNVLIGFTRSKKFSLSLFLDKDYVKPENSIAHAYMLSTKFRGIKNCAKTCITATEKNHWILSQFVNARYQRLFVSQQHWNWFSSTAL